MKLTRYDYCFDGVTARYLLEEESGAIGLTLLPEGKTEDQYDRRRIWLKVPELVRIGMDGQAWRPGYLVHLALRGDAQSNGAGTTLKHGASTHTLRFVEQKREGDQITTLLRSPDGYEICHRLRWLGGCFRVETEFRNTGSKPVILDLLRQNSV